MPNANFVVLTTQRTGSTWLIDLLNQMPNTEGHVELFLPEKRKTTPHAGFNDVPRFCEYPHKGLKFRPFSTWNYLDDLYSRDGFVGFKLMYSHLWLYPEIVPYLALRRISIIHLIRNNSLDVVISEALAEKLIYPHAVEGDKSDKTTSTQVTLDGERAVRRIQKIETNKSFAKRIVRWLPCPKHEISYEDLKDNPATFQDVCEFIGIDPNVQNAASRLKKRQVLSRNEAIENFEEIRMMLAKDNLEHLCY